MIVAIAVAAALTLPSVMLILGSAYLQRADVVVSAWAARDAGDGAAGPDRRVPVCRHGSSGTGRELVDSTGVARRRTSDILPGSNVPRSSRRSSCRRSSSCLFMSHSSGSPRLSFTRCSAACSASRHWMACSSGTGKSRSPAPICRSETRSCCGRAGPRALLLVPYAFAYIERAALKSPGWTAALAATLAGIVLTIKIIDRVQRRERRQVDFDERPAPPTQRLGVFESMAIHD